MCEVATVKQDIDFGYRKMKRQMTRGVGFEFEIVRV